MDGLYPLRQTARRRARPGENPADKCRAYWDGVGELHVLCPECAEQEFAPNAPASGRASGGGAD